MAFERDRNEERTAANRFEQSASRRHSDVYHLTARQWQSCADAFRTNIAFVCLAEALAEAYVIAPPEFILFRETQPVPLERFRSALTQWMS